MTPVIPRSRSRKVNGYVKAVLALEAVRKKREGSLRPVRAPARSEARRAGGRGRCAAGAKHEQHAVAQGLLAVITRREGTEARLR